MCFENVSDITYLVNLSINNEFDVMSMQLFFLIFDRKMKGQTSHYYITIKQMYFTRSIIIVRCTVHDYFSELHVENELKSPFLLKLYDKNSFPQKFN
jgi:hypothetical protein